MRTSTRAVSTRPPPFLWRPGDEARNTLLVAATPGPLKVCNYCWPTTSVSVSNRYDFSVIAPQAGLNEVSDKVIAL